MKRIVYPFVLTLTIMLAVIPQPAKAQWDFFYFDWAWLEFYYYQYVEPVYQAVVDPPPPPPPSCANSGQVGNYPNCFPPPPPQVATVCWGSCWNDSNEGAGAFVEYYLSLVVMEFGSIDAGSVIGTDSQGRINYIACFNGGVVSVDYGGPAPTCADYGQVGTFPDCSQPPYPTPYATPYSTPYATPYSTPYTTPAVPTVDISASPDRVNSGAQSTVTWTSTNATTCTVSGPGLSSTALTGNQAVSITTQSTYTINCSGVTDSAIVNVAPTFEEF
jgi:hypothetical protein